MKRKIFTIFMIIMLLTPICVLADTGPKPSLIIHVKNFKTKSYKLDVLIKEGERGINYESFNEHSKIKYPESYKELPIYKYREDGWIAEHIRNHLLFGSLEGEYNEKTNMMDHKFSYVGVPDIFKVIIQYDNGELFVSKKITPRQFRAEVVLDASTGEIYKIPMMVRDIGYNIRLFLITIIIEFIIALFFKVKPKKSVIIANVITQPVLQLLVYLIFILTSYMAANIAFYMLEIAIVFIEYLIYKKYMQYESKQKIFLYSLIANAASFGLGLLL